MFVLVALVFYLLIGIPIAAVLLRASISLANRFLPDTGGQSRMEEVAVMEPAGSVDQGNPYNSPSVATAVSGGVIPEPSFGQAYGVCIVQAIAGFVLSFVLGLIVGSLGNDASGRMVATVISMLISLPMYAGILMAMLPTSFLRGLLVMLCQFLIGIVIGGIIFGLIVATGLAF